MAEAEEEATLAWCAREAQAMRMEVLLGDMEDACDCYAEVQAGAGGRESCDWADMLLHMYSRAAHARGWSGAWSGQLRTARTAGAAGPHGWGRASAGSARGVPAGVGGRRRALRLPPPLGTKRPWVDAGGGRHAQAGPRLPL